MRVRGGNSTVMAIGGAALFVVALMLLLNSESSDDNFVANDNANTAARLQDEDQPPLPGYKCTTEEKQKQNERFKRRDREAWAHTACPDESWLEKLQSAFQEIGRKKLEIYDIGCNKGYTSANFLASFAPDYGVNPMNTWHAIEDFAKRNKVSIDKSCGVCGDCYENIKVAPGLGPEPFDVRVHCFEPAPSSFAILQHVYNKLKPSSSRHEWVQHNLGLYNQSGEMMWHESCAHAGGGELCGIVEKGTPNAIKVPVVTVDDFARKTGVRPDLLKIDAEGFDPAVLAGSEETLNSGETPLVLFEFNPELKSGGLWHKIKLDPVIEWFDTLGYDCYFESDTKGLKDPLDAPSFYRITGDCLSTFPTAFRGWSNVICGNRRYEAVTKVLSDRATMIGH